MQSHEDKYQSITNSRGSNFRVLFISPNVQFLLMQIFSMMLVYNYKTYSLQPYNGIFGLALICTVVSVGHYWISKTIHVYLQYLQVDNVITNRYQYIVGAEIIVTSCYILLMIQVYNAINSILVIAFSLLIYNIVFVLWSKRRFEILFDPAFIERWQMVIMAGKTEKNKETINIIAYSKNDKDEHEILYEKSDGTLMVDLIDSNTIYGFNSILNTTKDDEST